MNFDIAPTLATFDEPSTTASLQTVYNIGPYDAGPYAGLTRFQLFSTPTVSLSLFATSAALAQFAVAETTTVPVTSAGWGLGGWGLTPWGGG